MKILFVCLGNICRSPLAEALLSKKLVDAGISNRFLVDSAGTSNYHIGQPADARTRANAEKHGIDILHAARQIQSEDLDEFDLIIAMDKSNVKDINLLLTRKDQSAKIKKMRDFDIIEPGADVPDPWYGGDESFEEVYRILDRSTGQLFQKLLEWEGGMKTSLPNRDINGADAQDLPGQYHPRL